MESGSLALIASLVISPTCLAIIEIYILMPFFPANVGEKLPVSFSIVLLIYIEKRVTVEYVKGHYDLKWTGSHFSHQDF